MRKERFDGLLLSRCPICGDMIDYALDFRDELSRVEFKISGLCQHCQDITFTGEPCTK